MEKDIVMQTRLVVWLVGMIPLPHHYWYLYLHSCNLLECPLQLYVCRGVTNQLRFHTVVNQFHRNQKNVGTCKAVEKKMNTRYIGVVYDVYSIIHHYTSLQTITHQSRKHSWNSQLVLLRNSQTGDSLPAGRSK